MAALVRAWRGVLDLYLGNHGYRAALLAYAVGFWIFAVGAGLAFLAAGGGADTHVPMLHRLLMTVGLAIVVFMSYPVLRCAFRAGDPTRPRSRLRRIAEPAVIGALAPVYLMLLVASLMYLIAGPAFLAAV